MTTNGEITVILRYFTEFTKLGANYVTVQWLNFEVIPIQSAT